MSQNISDEKSTLVQTVPNLSQCLPKSVMPYGVVMPKWVNINTKYIFGITLQWQCRSVVRSAINWTIYVSLGLSACGNTCVFKCPKTDLHDDVIKWKHFPRYWPFVWGIHRSLVNPPQRPVTRSFDVFFDLRLDKRQSKQSRGCHRAHYDVTVMIYKRHSSPGSLPVI